MIERKRAPSHHDNPDADEPVQPGTGSDAQAFPLAEICQDVVGEMLLRFHLRLIVILAPSPTDDSLSPQIMTQKAQHESYQGISSTPTSRPR
jgi:hypothetical protein